MNSKYLFCDPPITELPAENLDFTTENEKCSIFGSFLRSGGVKSKKRPLILLLHGIPGHEKNLDLAQALRRTGVNTAFFSYRGCWGSEGEYRISNLVPDTIAVLRHLFEHSDEYNIDTENVWLLGHSLGGFTALHTLAGHATPLRGAVLVAPCDLGMMYEEEKQAFGELIDPEDRPGGCLNVPFAGALRKEAESFAAGWRFSAIAEKLKDYPLCFIGGGTDTITPIRRHILPLMNELEAKAEYYEINDGHGFASSRVVLTKTVAEWFEKQINRTCGDWAV